MNDMQSLDRQLAEKERQQAEYDRAMERLNYHRGLREGEGLTLMFAWSEFGEQLKGKSMFARGARLAEMFCITFAFLAPSLLLLKYVL